ncbi:MAG: hypothetical protein Q9209_007472 [Squamulea sp. 1 TL-2023]
MDVLGSSLPEADKILFLGHFEDFSLSYKNITSGRHELFAQIREAHINVDYHLSALVCHLASLEVLHQPANSCSEISTGLLNTFLQWLYNHCMIYLHHGLSSLKDQGQDHDWLESDSLRSSLVQQVRYRSNELLEWLRVESALAIRLYAELRWASVPVWKDFLLNVLHRFNLEAKGPLEWFWVRLIGGGIRMYRRLRILSAMSKAKEHSIASLNNKSSTLNEA